MCRRCVVCIDVNGDGFWAGAWHWDWRVTDASSSRRPCTCSGSQLAGTATAPILLRPCPCTPSNRPHLLPFCPCFLPTTTTTTCSGAAAPQAADHMWMIKLLHQPQLLPRVVAVLRRLVPSLALLCPNSRSREDLDSYNAMLCTLPRED